MNFNRISNASKVLKECERNVNEAIAKIWSSMTKYHGNDGDDKENEFIENVLDDCRSNQVRDFHSNKTIELS